MPEGGLEALTLPDIDGSPCLDLSTHYFTSRQEDPVDEAIPFVDYVDPKGLLLAMSNGGLFHGSDNEVLYYEMLKNNSGNKPK